MERIKNKKYIIFDNIADLLCPLVFLVSGVINFLLYYVGLMNEDSSLRETIFDSSLILYTLFMVVLGLRLLKDSTSKFRYISILGSILVTGYVAVYSFMAYGNEMMLDIVTMIVFINTSYISGYYIYTYKKYDKFFVNLEKLSLILLPGLIIYGLLAATGTNPYKSQTSLGVMNYMVIANIAMVIVFALIINMFNKDNKLFGIFNFKHKNAVRLALIVFLWYFVILASGTRSSILTVLFFSVLIIALSIFLKSNIKKSIALSLVLVVTFVFQLFVPLNIASSERMLLFLEDLIFNQRLTTTYTDDLEDLDIEDYQSAVDVEIDEINPSDSTTDENKDDAVDLVAENIRGRDRLFTLALLEGIKNPFTGLGPFGYTYKYDIYPHNFALELISDFGIVVGGLMCLAIFIILIRMIILARNDKNIMYLVVFVLGYLIVLMSSGTAYHYIQPAFALGFSIPYLLDKRKEKKLARKSTS